MENSFIITVRSDIGAGVSGSNQGITALLDLSTKSGIADKDCSDIYLSFDTDSLEGSISKGQFRREQDSLLIMALCQKKPKNLSELFHKIQK